MTNSWDVYPMKVIRDSVPPTLFDEVSGRTRVEVCQADHNLLASLPMMEVGGREGRDKNSEVHPTAAHRSALSVAASHPSQLVEIYTRLTVYSSLDPRSTLRHFKRGTDLTTPPPSLRVSSSFKPIIDYSLFDAPSIASHYPIERLASRRSCFLGRIRDDVSGGRVW